MLISIVFSCVPEFYYCTTNSPNNNSFLLYLINLRTKNFENSSAPSGINWGHLVVFSWQMVQRVLESFITCMVPWEHLRALIRDSTRGFCSTTVSELSNILRGSTGLWKECSKEPQWQLQGFFPILEVSEHQFHQVLVSIGHWEQPRFKRRKIRTHLFMRGIANWSTIINLPHPVKSSHLYGILSYSWANLVMSNCGFSTWSFRKKLYHIFLAPSEELIPGCCLRVCLSW